MLWVFFWFLAFAVILALQCAYKDNYVGPMSVLYLSRVEPY